MTGNEQNATAEKLWAVEAERDRLQAELETATNDATRWSLEWAKESVRLKAVSAELVEAAQELLKIFLRKNLGSGFECPDCGDTGGYHSDGCGFEYRKGRLYAAVARATAPATDTTPEN